MSLKEIHSLYLKANGITTDTRNCVEGFIFFALKGANFDGNKFVNVAFDNGASWAVVDDPALKDQDRMIWVEDVLHALQELARYHRKYLGIPILGITGTNGKTTTKELVTCVLSEKFSVTSTSGNLNNHIGVPLTLLSMDKETEIGVVEMGANHGGEIEFLCSIAEPDYGIITNVGKAHLEGFGSFEGVKKAKAELYYFLNNSQGKAFLNLQNEHLKSMVPNGLDVLTYGVTSDAAVTGKAEGLNPFLSVVWSKKGQSHNVQTHLLGEYNCENVLAAVCIGLFFDVPAEGINKAIESYIPSNNRSQYVKTKYNEVLMDAYNANPSSMEVALRNFDKIRGENKTVILGGMKEMGASSKEEHQRLLEFLASLEIDHAFLIGEEFMNWSAQYENWQYFADVKELLQYLKEHPLNNAQVLVKGSRSNKLEVVLDYL
ncbi:UDP-N-acetylmuramoyl-tripeptide--D-alanyl-D-alanine ligase [Marinilabiliaceae bacterium JC017]|nr:UDP-N-acetylmuramoyl-tripeptide--D-alanyl-D-alanine ligase [Marinilabiliaceae bacterium JC017]